MRCAKKFAYFQKFLPHYLESGITQWNGLSYGAVGKYCIVFLQLHENKTNYKDLSVNLYLKKKKISAQNKAIAHKTSGVFVNISILFSSLCHYKTGIKQVLPPIKKKKR